MKRIIKITSLFILSILLVHFVSTIIVYESIFNYRCTSLTYLMPTIEDYENLESTRHEFNTNKNNKLVGYLYSNKEIEEKALVVFSHGLGSGGQIGYLEIYNYLTSNGYYVFAYDATANDESEGSAIGGLPQGIIDLDNTINYVKTIEEVKDLPLMLMGYSFGAYSVSNVLNYQTDIKAIVSIAGWNESINQIEYRSSLYVKDFSKVLVPFVRMYERMKYGKYATSKAMNAFDNTNSKIMIIHGENDESVPIEYGYNMFYEKYHNDERFIFKYYDNRNHTNIYYDEEKAIKYDNFLTEFELYKSKNKITNEDIINYVNQNLDKELIVNKLDYSLFKEIIEFYDSTI